MKKYFYINRRNFIKAALTTTEATMLGSMLAACGSQPAINHQTSGAITITYWDWWGSQAPWVDNEIKLFQQAHPGIIVKKTTQHDYTYSKLYAAAYKAHQAPDIAMIPQQPDFNVQVSQGWYMPVNKWANSTWQARFPQGTFYEGNNIINGKLYTAPFTGSAPNFQLYINNQVFRNAGLINPDGSIKIPKTWDDVTQAAETITRKSNGQVSGLGFGSQTADVLSWWLDVFLYGAGSPGGAYGMDLRVGKYTYGTDRNYADFLSLFKDWNTRGYFYPNALNTSDEQAQSNFVNGKVGMTVAGVWVMPSWKSKHKFTDYTLTTLISPTQTPQGYFPKHPGGQFVAISSQTKHADEAWAWFNWLYSVDAGKRWVQMGEDLSVFPQNNDPTLINFAPFAQYVGLARLAMNAPDPLSRNPALARVQMGKAPTSIVDIMSGYYSGKIADVQAALSELEDAKQNLLADAVKQAQQQGYKVSLDDYKFPDWNLTTPYTMMPGTATT
jgi:ABC-type glycerol-3-phosphate transport system substrate-binding protein